MSFENEYNNLNLKNKKDINLFMNLKIKNKLINNKFFIVLKSYILYIFLYFIIFYLLIFKIKILYLDKKKNKIINNKNKELEIEIDNEINISKYEENIDFSNYTSNIKVISLYLPIYYSTKNDECYLNDFDYWEKFNNIKSLYKEHNQQRKQGDIKNYLDYYDLTKPEVIKKQVNLAKSHGIYGFAIYYYLINGKRLFYKPLDIYLNNKDINFPYFLVLRNENLRIKCKRNSTSIYLNQFIENIKIFLFDTRYIKIKEKLLIGIYQPKMIKNLKNIIIIWRKKARKIGLGELFIIVNLNINNYKKQNYSNIFNGIYDYPPFTIEKKNLLKYKNYYYYSGIIYYINSKLTNNNIKIDFNFYYSSVIKWYNTSLKKDDFIFNDFSSEKFYILNKLLIQWTNINYINDKVIFINSWNNWIDGSYLEPDENNGYSSINSLSKALFNLSYKNINNTNLFFLLDNKKLAVQVHIFYEDLINEIIIKTNNIPINFDLYITTTNLYKKKIIEKYIIKYSKSYNYNITIIKNKGRDVLPMLIQLKNVIKEYKYICHIHSKKTIYSSIGKPWRQYLYENLLGSKEIISEILFDFEYYNKLGFIFPETFYKCIPNTWFTHDKNKQNINYLLNKIFPGFKMGKKIDFPAGNMFWAKIEAIYQIFDLDIYNKFPEENNFSSYTIMHAIERIWLYLVKLNGYVYKKIFKHI